MQGGEPNDAETRTITYCIVPFDLAAKLHGPLREHFAADPAVEVIVEQRSLERRRSTERRQRTLAADDERRLIRNAEGRRAGPRRAPTMPLKPLALPRRARAYVDRLAFVERVEPSEEHLADLDSARLVTRAQAGDPDAFSTLYLRYFDRVYAYLKVLFRDDPHEVEDITQQVFVRAFEALPRYERRAQPFRAWLFTIVRNLALTHLGRQGRTDLVDPHMLAEQREAESTNDSTSTLSWVTDRELVMFVERLPVPQRQVLVLKYMLDLPAKEIAKILDRSYVDVRTLEHRALRFLEARLRAVGRHSLHEGRRPLPAYAKVRWMPVLRRRRGALYDDPGRVMARR